MERERAKQEQEEKDKVPLSSLVSTRVVNSVLTQSGLTGDFSLKSGCHREAVHVCLLAAAGQNVLPGERVFSGDRASVEQLLFAGLPRSTRLLQGPQ